MESLRIFIILTKQRVRVIVSEKINYLCDNKLYLGFVFCLLLHNYGRHHHNTARSYPQIVFSNGIDNL